MLACLPASGDLPTRLLSCTQMNTGLQKWETTQKMRSANYPTPAELDAYAKRVANNPLTIQIFPNSVKVPQRKHIRRTVNGLDTLSSQRHSPYPSQVSATVGLLAVLRAPNKSFIKDSNSGRGRLLHKAVMNPHGGSYATQSTLNISQPTPDQHGLAQSHALGQTQGVAHPQMLLQQPQTLPHPQALQQRSMAHPQALQRQQSLQTLPQGLAHQQGLQRQQSFPHTQSHRPQQNPPLLQQQTAPHNTAALQQGLSQDLRLMSDGAQPPSLQHPQAVPGPQVGVTGPPAVPNSLQPQHLPGAYGSRKITDADAPPNVTVSTSTIPLSMAASLHQNRPSDLSSIVHQINQFCQARAGMGITSVCEGQIANPSPISRNLLINASSRVSTHNPAPGPGLSCLLGAGADKVPSQNPAALQSQPSVAVRTNLSAFHPEVEQHQRMQQQLQKQKQQQLQQQQHQLQMQQLQQQQQQQQQRSWTQHQLAHLQQPPEGAHPCKNPRREGPSASGFSSRNISYPHKLPSAAQSFPLKHPADKPHSMSPISGPVGSLPYTNGHYMQPPWPRIPASANNNCSGPHGSQVGPFHGSQVGPSTECIARQQYRQGATGPPGQAKLVPSGDFLGGDFQVSTFNEQNLGMMEKIQMTPMGQEPSSSRGVHTHHPGYL